MNKLSWLIAAAAIIFAIVYRNLFPKEVERIVVGPPSKPDTVFVERIVVDSFIDVRTVFSTDTVNLVQTVMIADTVRVPCGATVPVTTYVSQIEVGEDLGDSTWVFGEKFSADSAGLNFVPFAQSVWTAGLMRGLLAEGDSVRIDFDPFPKPKSCSFLEKAEWFLVGGATGIIVRTVW